MKRSIIWLLLGSFLISLVSTFDLQDHPQRWRYHLAMASCIIFFLFFLVGLVIGVRKKRKHG